MRTLGLLLRKEFKQVIRNKAILPIIFVMPIIQLLILPLTANFEVTNISIAIVDSDHSSYSAKLIRDVTSSSYFKLSGMFSDFESAYTQIENNKADIILEIPPHFEENIVRENSQKIRIAVNAINGVKAGLGGNYISKILMQYNNDIRLQWISGNQGGIDIQSTNWFNPHFNYRLFMVPGILVLLVTIVSALLSSNNIVREKEIGTIEQINVTPIKKHIFIIGKLLPFLIISLIVFTFGLFVVARLVYGIVPVGSLWALYSYLIVYLIGLLGVGLLISTYANTQQQAMSLAFFFMMIFVLMCGLFTPIDSMPLWAQVIAYCNPVTYFIEVNRMIVLKGSGFSEISRNFLITGIFAVVLNAWAIINYKKRG